MSLQMVWMQDANYCINVDAKFPGLPMTHVIQLAQLLLRNLQHIALRRVLAERI